MIRRIDPFTVLLLCVIIMAVLAPVAGAAAVVMKTFS